MEPRQQSHEQLPDTSAQPEKLSVLGEQPASIETHQNRNEALERRLGQQVESASQLPAQPSAASLPAPVSLPLPASSDDSDNNAAPLVAADEDLIEKEWVDKAKKIIAETKDDPHRREAEVSKLQIEYVRKRYGRIIGDDGSNG